jgi:hypothetical protein
VRDRLGVFADEDPDGIRLTAEIVRARLMSGDPEAARELVEATLSTAERLGLRAVVAELLPSRAWAISAERPFEALALLRGALVFAEREGLFNAEMRSRMNLSSFASLEAPAESLEVAWTGVVRALERGYMGWALSAAGNAASSARMIGAWDRVEAMAVQLDALGEWTGPWEFSVPSEVLVVRAFRGRIAEARELQDRFDDQFGDVADPQMRLTGLASREVLAFAEGDLVAAIGHGRDANELAIALGFDKVFAIPLAVAAEAHDAARLDELAAPGGPGLTSMRLSAAIRLAAAAAGRVLAGDLDALDDLDRAADAHRQADARFDLALVLRSRYLLAPAAPGAAGAAAEATAILSELGALTLLRGLPDQPAGGLPIEPAVESVAEGALPSF